ncbi:hypothetical protein GGX14DRAFT_401603 [Mycena pura]|uniref:Uncharacterized protein n=1 Tax=Mycena pura TaxID=153505 RepID=A0AAD6Y368_9AGAR|nr:hypothetical protein GGX14DRAFT_401603 [Mycena pura]
MKHFVVVATLSLVFSAMVAGSAPTEPDTVGQASLFIPTGSPQQCGSTVTDSDLAVLISPDVFESGARCGDSVTVAFESHSVVLEVAGECVCIASSIEMTQAAYTALGAPVLRPVTVNWAFD